MKKWLLSIALKQVMKFANEKDLRVLLKGISNQYFPNSKIDDLGIDAIVKLIFKQDLPVDEIIALYKEVKANVTSGDNGSIN